jgi:hypothetical protein
MKTVKITAMAVKITVIGHSNLLVENVQLISEHRNRIFEASIQDV